MSLSIFPKARRIEIDIPLTTPMGKIRIKKRADVFAYGAPFAGRQTPFDEENYVEWQIGYGMPPASAAGNAALANMQFCDSTGENKALHELSECLFYFAKWGVIQKQELHELKDLAGKIPAADLLADNRDCRIKRTRPAEKNINGIRFDALTVEYPQLVHRFGGCEVIAEITIREKQRAAGVQPMLYFCFPIAALSDGQSLIGRCAETKECAQFVFDQNNCFVVLEMMRVFGMLSAPHQHDVVAIIDAVLPFAATGAKSFPL